MPRSRPDSSTPEPRSRNRARARRDAKRAERGLSQERAEAQKQARERAARPGSTVTHGERVFYGLAIAAAIVAGLLIFGLRG